MTHDTHTHTQTNKQNNYTQVIALAKSFPLRWPAALNTLFEIQGAVSTLGDHIVNVDCVSATASGAELFYSKQVMYAHGLRRGTPFFAKREQKRTKTPKDKFVVTVTAIIFLMYPTLCNQAFSLFSCKWVGNKQYLQADLEEPCYEGRHLSLALALGGPQLLVYVIGLPTLVLFFLRRNRAHESTNGSSTEPGADDTIADEANNANKNVGVFDGYETSEAQPGQGLFGNPVVMTRWGLFFKGCVSGLLFFILISFADSFFLNEASHPVN